LLLGESSAEAICGPLSHLRVPNKFFDIPGILFKKVMREVHEIGC